MMLSHKIVVVITATYAFLHKLMVDAQIVGSTWSYSTSFETTPLGGGGLFNNPLGSKAKLTDGTNADATGANLRGGTPDFIPSATNQNLSPSVSAPRPSAPPVLAPAAPPIGLILGGEPAGKGVYSYHVHLQGEPNASGYFDYCGGSLLSSDIVLTAAHCLQYDFKYALLGVYNLADNLEYRENITVCDQVQHPEWYDSDFEQHDVALIRLCEESDYVKNGTIYPIMLNSNPNCPVTDQKLTVTGFGQSMPFTPDSSSDILLKADLFYVSQEQCINDYTNSPDAVEYEEKITSDEMCASDNIFYGGQDQCPGDSGGALVIGTSYTNFVEVGLVSHNYGKQKCPYNLPSVYSRISASLNWILDFGCCLTRAEKCDILWTDLCEKADRKKAKQGKMPTPKGGKGSGPGQLKKGSGGNKKIKTSKPVSKPSRK